MKKFWILLVLIVFVISTSSIKENSNEWEKEILGKWSFYETNKTESILIRVEEFEKDKSGLEFLGDGKFIYYSFTGPCATPPRIRSRNRGFWSKTNDNILATNYKTWSGVREFKMFIKEVSSNKLVIQFIKDKSH